MKRAYGLAETSRKQSGLYMSYEFSDLDWLDSQCRFIWSQFLS